MRFILQGAGAALSFVFGAASILLAAVMFSLSIAMAKEATDPWMVIIAAVLMVVLYFAWRLMGRLLNVLEEQIRNLDQRLLDRRAWKAAQDNRPFILYLRSFKTDTGVELETAPDKGLYGFTDSRVFFSAVISGYSTNGRRKSMDEAVYDATGFQFPIICIGNKVTTVGATRVSTTDQEWKAVFLDLASRAKAIVCVPFPSAGSLWEIEWIGQNAIQKTVFLVPDDTSVGKDKSYEPYWNQSLTAFGWLGQIPPYRDSGFIFTVPAEKTRATVWALKPAALRNALLSVGLGVRPNLRPIILAAYWIALAAIIFHAAKADGQPDYIYRNIGFFVMAGILAAMPLLVYAIEWVKRLWYLRLAR